jgi:hypothetical protein
MSTFTYNKPGIGNAASFQVAGIPFIRTSTAPAVGLTTEVINLPRVAKNIAIKNINPTDVALRVSFNNDSVLDNENYILLSRGESFSADFRVTDIHCMSDSSEPVLFTVIASITNIDRSEMTQLTPTPPNLLAWVQKQKLIANDPDGSPEGDFFGRVTMTGDGRILAAGASSDEENGGASAGCVYIFQSGSGGYQQVQKLTASGDANPAGDSFGVSVSISSTGETLAVGAYLDEENGGANAGSVYIFQSGSGGYQQVQKLTASGDANPGGDTFGRTVSISATGETVAVGAQFDEENGVNAGSVYIFQSGSGGYQQVQKLTASGDADPAGDQFGSSVSISATGETLVVGSPSDEENGGANAGSVYIFQSSSLGYQQVQKLTASGDADPAADQFGSSVSVFISSTGETLAIGSRSDEENGGADAGSVYIFQSSSLGYQQVQKLTASGDADPAADQFGSSVSISATGETVAVGSRSDEENGGANAGSVYIFQSSSLGYQQTNKLTASFGTDGLPEVSPEGDRFGADFISLNIAGDVITIGARFDEENGGTNAGSVYIFKYTRDY